MKKIINLAVFTIMAFVLFSCNKEEGYPPEYITDMPLRIHINLVNEKGESYVEGKMVEEKFPNLKIVNQGKEYYFNKKNRRWVFELCIY